MCECVRSLKVPVKGLEWDNMSKLLTDTVCVCVCVNVNARAPMWEAGRHREERERDQ